MALTPRDLFGFTPTNKTMISPEMLEYAEENGYYIHKQNIGDGLNSNYGNKNHGPNFYELLSQYNDSFTISNNTIEPTKQEIAYIRLEDSYRVNHPSGNPTKQKTTDVGLSIEATGQLELNEEHTKVVSGHLEILYNYHLL